MIDFEAFPAVNTISKVSGLPTEIGDEEQANFALPLPR
jgi:hypothetical protein